VTTIIKGQGPADDAVSDYGNEETLNLDLEAIALPDDSIDVVVASHVLEHVDDKKALAEIRRVLRSDGVAPLMVPIVEGWDSTYVDPSITTRSE
jgi:ubiquinone/menaquinone biosynthesis C-methylase UbiE